MACEVPKGKPTGGNHNLWLCQVSEGGGRLLSHVARGSLAPDSVRKRTKAPLGTYASCKKSPDGTDTVLTFLQGLGSWTEPLEGRFMTDFQARKPEFTEKHIIPFALGPCEEMPT